MANLTSAIMSKFGLSSTPTENQIEKWAELTIHLISNGTAAEDAGRLAARQIFPDCFSYMQKSQSDTILTLLAQVKKK